MENDAKPMGVSYAKRIISRGRYYTSLVDSIVIREIDMNGEKMLISSNTEPSSNWKLTKESKMLGEFKCYKALKSKMIKNRTGEFNFEIVAWYAPEIPVKLGPKEYHNLPGLILELKDTHYTFYAEKIQIMPKEKVRIKPIEGNTITEDEYKIKIKKSIDDQLIRIKN